MSRSRSIARVRPSWAAAQRPDARAVQGDRRFLQPCRTRLSQILHVRPTRTCSMSTITPRSRSNVLCASPSRSASVVERFFDRRPVDQRALGPPRTYLRVVADDEARHDRLEHGDAELAGSDVNAVGEPRTASSMSTVDSNRAVGQRRAARSRGWSGSTCPRMGPDTAPHPDYQIESDPTRLSPPAACPPTSPAGFQWTAVASSATATKAPPMPRARDADHLRRTAGPRRRPEISTMQQAGCKAKHPRQTISKRRANGAKLRRRNRLLGEIVIVRGRYN